MESETVYENTDEYGVISKVEQHAVIDLITFSERHVNYYEEANFSLNQAIAAARAILKHFQVGVE